MTRFCMPYNGDQRLVDIILSDYTGHVASLFGSMGTDPFGGGRALANSQHQSIDSFRQTVARLDQKGIEFNYVINNTNMMNRECSAEYREKYRQFLLTLQSAGVRTVTLSNIAFIALTKELMPDWKISASVNLKPRTVDEVRFLLSLGCGEITLYYSILKDPKALREIRAITNIDLKLIPNDIHIMDCPWQKGHSRMEGAHSRAKEFKTPYFSYYRNKCVHLRHLKPEEILKAMWIPPDQLWRYEALGYDYFKLLDRLASTDWNIRVLNAYIEAKPRADLETMLGTYGVGATKNIPDPVEGDERPYPKDKLEVIPSINSEKAPKNFSYFLNEDHPVQCGDCKTCLNSASSTVKFLDEARLQAIENNRKWRTTITKMSFIEQLEGFNRRIQYE
ncbi:MAG: hypothetical protein PHD48_11040 [Alphaproteobacteria bacterium]|nr:hypothetical protein [Alphaproteobacteria bacterium]